MVNRGSDWRCVNEECNRVLGQVLGGEFHPSGDYDASHFRTRGPNLVVRCPDCGTLKVWYTADPITRAIYQLVDAVATQGARRMIRVVGEETRNME